MLECTGKATHKEVSKTMTTSIQLSEKPVIEYPDDDGEPMADNTLQCKWIILIKENLEIVFRDNPKVFVAGNLLWYAVEGDPKIRTAPDAMVAIGRPKGHRGSYKQWEEGNIAPQVVFETLWPDISPDYLEQKFRFYEQYGALEADRRRAEAERKRAYEPARRAETERTRADAAAERARAEGKRADAIEKRIERMAARLRELGIDPDSI
jgi:hypothetical protein